MKSSCRRRKAISTVTRAIFPVAESVGAERRMAESADEATCASISAKMKAWRRAHGIVASSVAEHGELSLICEKAAVSTWRRSGENILRHRLRHQLSPIYFIIRRAIIIIAARTLLAGIT